MKLVLHIGTEKTGSSSIQKMLTSLHDISLEAPFYFPQDNPEIRLRDGNFLGLYWWIRGLPATEVDDQLNCQLRKNIRKRLRMLQSQLDQACQCPVVFSNEHLSRLDDREAKSLCRKLGKHFSDTNVVSFLRGHLSWSLSMTSQALKGGFCSSADQLLLRFFNRTPMSVQCYQNWSNVPVKRVLFKEYRSRSKDFSLGNAFLDCLEELYCLTPEEVGGLKQNALSISAYENSSLPYAMYAVASEFNRRISELSLNKLAARSMRQRGHNFISQVASQSVGLGAFTSECLDAIERSLIDLQRIQFTNLGHLRFSEYFYDLNLQFQKICRYSRPYSHLSPDEEYLVDEALSSCSA